MPLDCPRCQKPLEVVLEDGIEVDVCKSCKGIWVEFADEKKVLQMKPEVFTMDELRRLRRKYEPIGLREKVQYLACPNCKQLMWRKNWGSHSGVIVDKCEEHGTWYDDGEIEKIREFIVIGGVEYEKMRAPERGLVRLESKLIQEVSRLDQRVDSAYRRARFWSMIGF